MSRLTIALHLAQESLPPSGASTQQQQNNRQAHPPSSVAGSGSGYGPPLTATPLSHLISTTLYNAPVESASEGYSPQPATKTEYDLVALPLTNNNWAHRWERMCTFTQSATEAELGVVGSDESNRAEAELWRAGGAFTRSEVNLTRSEESGSLLGFAADWLELDSPVEGIRFDSELALRQEIQYASYLSLTTIVVPPPRPENREFLTDYARAINAALSSSWHINIAIKMPVAEYTPEQLQARPATPAPGAPSLGQDRSETWEAWNTIRTACAYSPRLTLALDLSSPLPPPLSLGRWHAEPLSHLFLPCTSFIPNAKGYPVLSKSMQAFLKSIFKFGPTVILSGTQRGLHSAGGHLAYAQYIRYTHRKSLPPNPVEQYAQGYMDHLQQPLQPLMDNLEGETYEGFEKDPIKYRQYEQAVYAALCDRSDKVITTIFVVGAGRGPLVAGVLRAAERARRRVQVTAVEKNPSAFVILQEREALEWGQSVKLVFSDMRSFNPREKADIIVSELLGSFGDNELSPECLDGVMRCLKPDGISIPSSYTSYLAPITSTKLHQEVTAAASTSTQIDRKPAEQPYVVMFSAFHQLSAAGGRLGVDAIQECWTFDHPRPDVVVGADGLPFTNHHNARSAHLTFHIPRAGVCHGFAGYFEAVLYGDVGLSIHPERSAGDMLSWFPIFFPLAEPIYLPARSELDVQIWRMTDGAKRKVWFEWSAASYLSASALQFNNSTPTPPGSQRNSTASAGNHPYPSRRASGGAPGATSADTLSPRWDNNPNSGRNQPGGGAFSPMVDAFVSAPSPMIGSNADGRMQGIVEEGAEAEDETRILVGYTRLHNAQGRSSFVGL